MKIPRIIHQIWNSEKIPNCFLQYQKSVKNFHRHWKYCLWTEKKIRNLIKSDFPKLLHLYESLKYPVQKADLARYCILYKKGGVYLDLDVESCKSLDNAIEKLELSNKCVLLCKTQQCGGNPITNFIMASKPNHDFFLNVLIEICEINRSKIFNSMKFIPFFRHFFVIFGTGPQVLQRCYQKKFKDCEEIGFLNTEEFNPYKPMDQKTKKPSIYIIHHSESSWCKWDSKLLIALEHFIYNLKKNNKT